MTETWSGSSLSGQFYEELKNKIKVIPGVQSVSLASSVPITSFPSRQKIYVEGQVTSADLQLPSILFNRVDPDYFNTMRIPILLGREFSDSDNQTAPLVAIINHTMASSFWPGQQPIGKRFSIGDSSGPFLQVVGVAHDSKYQTIAEDSQPYYYVPLAQNNTSLQVVQIRSSIADTSLANQIQHEIHALDPAMTIVDMRTMTESLEGATGFFIFRLGASLTGFIGMLGLILAAVGVYGIVSYTTSRRTQEIGVRVALGATQRQILAMVVNQGMKTVFLGVTIGLLGAWALTRMMTHMLIGVSSSDPAVYSGVSILLCMVAFLACYLPARRAANVDPMVTLRYE